MIIKKFLSKIEINNYTLILLFLSLITGLFKEILVVFFIIIIHELGHYIIMYKYKWNVKKISIYPFGGVTILDDVIDKPLLEEFFVTIMGPIFQIILFIFVTILYKKYIINDYIYYLFKNYHYSMLLFNLLPIIPLDGSKLFNVFFNKFLNFRISYLFNIILSVITLTIFLLLYRFDSSYYIIIIFLIFQTIYTLKNRSIMFNRFILEKRLYKNNYRNYIKIRNIKSMHRNKKHLIFDKNRYTTENNYLKNRKI